MLYLKSLLTNKLKLVVVSTLIIYISANLINLYGNILPVNFIFFNRIFVVLIFIFLLFEIYLNKNKFLAPGLVGCFLFILYSYMLFFIHGMSIYSIYYAAGIIYNYFGFLIIINFLRSKADLKIFSFIYLILVGAGVIIYLIKWYQLGNWGILRPSNLAITGGNINANTVSALMVICLIVAEYLFKDIQKKWNLVLYIIYVIFLVGIFGLGSRYMSIIALGFLLISIYNNFKLKYFIFFLSPFIFILLSNSFFVFDILNDIKSVSRILNVGSESERLNNILMLTSMFLDAPLLGQSIEKIFITFDQKISHVVYFNYLVEGGIFGYIFLFIFFYSIFKKRIFKIDYIGKMFLFFWLSFYFWAPSYWMMIVPVSYIFLNSHFIHNK